jgi:hypothetical protein
VSRRTRSPWWVDAARGAVAGAVATWVMDLATTGLFDAQSDEVTAREEAARPNGRSSIGNLIARVESMTGLRLDDTQRALAEQAVHYGLGIGPGALYGILRDRVPLVGAGRGLLYGLALFVVNDEYLNTRLGLAGPYEAYPVETHWRGLVGHAVLGATTDTGIDLLGG